MAIPFIAPLDLTCLNSNHNSDQDSNEDDEDKQNDKNYDIARNSDLSSRHSKNTEIESKNKKNLATFEGSDSLKRKKWKELEIFPRQKKEHKQKQGTRIVAKTLQNYSER